VIVLFCAAWFGGVWDYWSWITLNLSPVTENKYLEHFSITMRTFLYPPLHSSLQVATLAIEV